MLVSEKMDATWCRDQMFDLTVSYTYRNILSKAHIAALDYNAFVYYTFWKEMCKQSESEGSYHSLKSGEKVRSIIDTYDINICEYTPVYNF